MILEFGTLTRIKTLILMGIVLIVASFSVTAYYQSQLSLMGNSINIAGKDRFLTSNAIMVSEEYIAGRATPLELNQAADTLQKNIKVLKSGGFESGFLLNPLPTEYYPYWNDMNQKWQIFQAAVSELNASSNPDQILEAENAGKTLISSSDTLVSQMSQGSTRDSDRLVQLQISLLTINVAIHTLFLFLIIRMVRPIVSVTRAASQIKKGKFVAVDQDSTAMNSNDEVSLLVRSFNEMVKGLENYDRAGKEFFHTAAHELRNPIQPILGIAEVLQQDDGSAGSPRGDERKQLLEAVVRNARKLEKLTEDILDVARIEGGTLNLRKEKLDLARLCSDVVSEYKGSSDGSRGGVQILFQNQSTTDHPMDVNADPLRITQVLYNLLNNALKSFSDSGVVVVKVQDNRKVAHEITVQVVDSGRGISPEAEAHLFEKSAFTTSANGGGPGLFISKRIIESHGGRMWAENNADGSGATFSFAIPALEQ